jgi:hypothetical protein
VMRIGNDSAGCLAELEHGIDQCSDASIFHHTFQSLGHHHFLLIPPGAKRNGTAFMCLHRWLLDRERAKEWPVLIVDDAQRHLVQESPGPVTISRALLFGSKPETSMDSRKAAPRRATGKLEGPRSLCHPIAPEPNRATCASVLAGLAG